MAAAAQPISQPAFLALWERTDYVGGQLLAHTTTLVHRPDVALAGPLSTTLTFVEPERDTPGVVELLEVSPCDGSERVIASQPVLIAGPRDGLAGAVALARTDLGARSGQPPVSIPVRTAEAVTWPDPAMGCPAPGEAYQQVLTPGYRVVLVGRAVVAGATLATGGDETGTGGAELMPCDRPSPQVVTMRAKTSSVLTP